MSANRALGDETPNESSSEWEELDQIFHRLEEDLLRKAAGGNERVRFRLEGEDRAKWAEELMEVCNSYLEQRSQAPNGGPPAAADWRQLVETGEAFRAALIHFISKWDEAPSSYFVRPLPFQEIPAGWREYRRACVAVDGRSYYADTGIGKHRKALDKLLLDAKEGLKHAKRGGRPRVDAVNLHCVRGLLKAYRHGFGRPPSPLHDGPTFRFVQAFFRSLEGEWESDPVTSNVPRRFSVERLEPSALRTLLQKGRRGESLPLRASWLEAVPLWGYSRFRRPLR